VVGGEKGIIWSIEFCDGSRSINRKRQDCWGIEALFPQLSLWRLHGLLWVRIGPCDWLLGAPMRCYLTPLGIQSTVGCPGVGLCQLAII